MPERLPFVIRNAFFLNELQSWTWQMEPALWATRYAMSEPALQVLESECLFERPSTEVMKST